LIISSGNFLRTNPLDLVALIVSASKKCWHIIKEDIYQLCFDFFEARLDLQAINSSLITLIPKVNSPPGVNDFRTISLLNCILKIITKLLGERLQTVIIPLVHQNQYGFIKSRTIQDCLAWAFEYIHQCQQSKQEIVIIKLDFTKAFDTIEHNSMHPDDVAKTAFRTHHGHFEFVVMAFGLTNAPPTFQALMNGVLHDYLRRFVLVFFDDILIYSSSWSEHLQHVRVVLTTLRQHQLAVKQSKCVFGSRSVAYLGHVISAGGVSMDPAKVDAVQAWPMP
jgi:hypothetical protein